MVSASLLIIGDEILSGRTQDKNTAYIAAWLNEAGIQLAEVRVVLDVEADIADAVNALRVRYDYVFTTGGIGPTHDDITAESIATAFGLPLTTHPEAYRLLTDYYGAEDFTAARQRMSKTPEGAALIENPVSIAPGFQVENVFVMAGVPKIMQAMLEALRPRLKTGRKIWSQAITIHAPESKMADKLGQIQNDVSEVSLGSYPFFRDGKIGTQIVVRSAEKAAIKDAVNQLVAYCVQADYPHEDPADIS
jgi:molybdenum cofactor synthesis domain-containing protein